MSNQCERYDRIAAGYERHWGPVIEPAAHRLLDRVAPLAERGAPRVLDLGTGTGALAVEVARRWPAPTIEAVDPSDGMLALARRRALDVLGPAGARRIAFTAAGADALPFDDASFDLVVSSFVLQLVPNRFRALREARRILRPGGTLAYVTWLVGQVDFAPDRLLDRTLDQFGYGPRESDGRNGDVPSVGAAVAQLRRAGFDAVTADADVLEHRFDPAGYVAFVAEFDEEDLFSELDPPVRRKLERRLLDRLARLRPDQFVLRLPVVRAIGRRPDSGRAGAGRI